MINDLLLIIDNTYHPTEKRNPDVGQDGGKTSVIWDKHASLRFNTNGKFDSESKVTWSDSSLFLFAGVLFNREEIPVGCLPEDIDSNDEDSLGEYLAMYRGNFCGVSADFGKRKATVFADQLGNMPLYYYCDNELFCCGSSVFSIAAILKERGKLNLSVPGAYCLISYAYMLHDLTLFSGIKRVLPGSMITFRLGGFSDNAKKLRNYYHIDNTPCPTSLNQAIEEVDGLFLQAVKRHVKLNARHGYKELCALSAGLDSRMTAFALSRVSHKPIVAFTYSQILQPDFEIPKKICHDLGWTWLFKSLDGGWDLLQIDDAIEISNGTNYYPWASQLDGFLRSISLSEYGVVHTGVIGDVVLGTFCDKRHNSEKFEIGDGAYSHELIPRLREMEADINMPEYDFERGMLYNRGLNGAALGYSLSFNQKTVAASPFMDVDFFSYCIKLPATMRSHHSLYYRWVENCYPKAAMYPHNGVTISSSRIAAPYHGRRIPLARIPGLMMNVIKAKDPRNSMNPLEWWYASNANLSAALDEFYIQHRDVLDANPVLAHDADELYINGSALEKTMCISLVGSLARAL